MSSIFPAVASQRLEVDPKMIAEREIRKAEHPCGHVTSASWRSAGAAIYAVCSNGEDYLVGSMRTNKGIVPYAMRCSALPILDMPRSSCKNAR